VLSSLLACRLSNSYLFVLLHVCAYVWVRVWVHVCVYACACVHTHCCERLNNVPHNPPPTRTNCNMPQHPPTTHTHQLHHAQTTTCACVAARAPVPRGP
jgi:hypothetical protein